MKYVYQSMLLASLMIAATLVRAEDKKVDKADTLPKFTVAKETTFITEPLTKDGYPDYPAALNEMLSKGVTAENNANVLFWQAHGPHPEGATMPAEFFELMGMKSPPEDGQHFLNLPAFLKVKAGAAEGVEKFFDQQGSAMEKPWKADEFPEIAAWLKANEKPLALVAEGAKRPKYFSPMVVTDEDRKESGMIGVLLPAVQSARGIARALVARAMLNIGEGRTEDAWQDLLTCHRLARHIGNGATLVEGLVGLAIEGIAMQGDLIFLDNIQPMHGDIEGYERDLKELPSFTTMAEKLDACERFIFLDSTFLIARGRAKMFAKLIGQDGGDAEIVNGLFMRFFDKGVDLDEILKTGNQWYDRLISAMREPTYLKRTKALQAVNVELKELAAQANDPVTLAAILFAKDRDKRTGRMFGSVMLSFMLPASEAVQSAEDRIEQQHRNLNLAFALAAYRVDHDHYPEELDALSPKYIAKVPVDLFTDKPLVYCLTDNGYLLYSIGPNGKDDGGNFYDDEPRGDDLRVRVPAQVDK